MMRFTLSHQSWILLLSLSVAMAQTASPITSSTAPISSSSPGSGPTATPVYAPAPSSSVSPAGSIVPGSSSPAPTLAPVNATDPLSDAPSDVPSGVPTRTPTVPPTLAPVSEPPSDHPSVAPTVAPSRLITNPPSAAKTAAPSGRPTVTPSSRPTTSPTGQPSNAPTAAPLDGTRVTEDVENISVTFLGALEEMNLNQMNQWQNLTADWFQSFFNDRRRRLAVEKDSIADVSTQLTVINQNFTSANAALGIPQNSYELKYTQRVSYIALNGSGNPDDYIVLPFNDATANDEYVQILRDQMPRIFEYLISPIMQPTIGDNNNNNESGSEGNTENKNDWLTPGVIAGIAIGGAAVILLGAFLVARSMRGGNDGYTEPGALPPQSFSVNAAEDISTIDDPTIGKVGSTEGFGDQSVNTVDYDYTRAYGGGGEASVVSSAGGTMGENTRQTTGDITSSAARVALGASSADYDTPYRDSSNIKEEVLEIIAPAGKLGVVIDTPDDGAPVVHAVKDSSVIADQIQVGDKLIAVDDEDVRSMTAIKVSKLISRKSANPSRKLTVIRTTVIEPDT